MSESEAQHLDTVATTAPSDVDAACVEATSLLIPPMVTFEEAASARSSVDDQHPPAHATEAALPRGEWLCHVCGNINKRDKKVCNMKVCSAPRGYPGPYYEPPAGVSGPEKQAKQWTCGVCGTLNRAGRTTRCFRQNCPGSRDDSQALNRVAGFSGGANHARAGPAHSRLGTASGSGSMSSDSFLGRNNGENYGSHSVGAQIMATTSSHLNGAAFGAMPPPGSIVAITPDTSQGSHTGTKPLSAPAGLVQYAMPPATINGSSGFSFAHVQQHPPLHLANQQGQLFATQQHMQHQQQQYQQTLQQPPPPTMPQQYATHVDAAGQYYTLAQQQQQQQPPQQSQQFFYLPVQQHNSQPQQFASVPIAFNSHGHVGTSTHMLQPGHAFLPPGAILR